MNRGKAERAVAESALTMAETLTMMMLLRRAHNDTLEIPDWRTPSQRELAAEVRISDRWLRLVLEHLGKHEWVKVTSGRGRGRKSAYLLMPTGAVPGPCDCKKRKSTSTFSQRKAELGRTEKRKSSDTTAQVTPQTAPRAPRGKVEEGGRYCACGAPVSPLRYAQAGLLCGRCEAEQ